MATLREITTARTVPLEPEHTVGRALTSTLLLDDRYVSAQHALLRYDGEGWTLRDLASANGTWLDGRRLLPGHDQRLRAGSRIAFGSLAADWELTDDAPPAVMIVPLDGGAPVVIEGDLLALPSPDEPSATIYRGLGGSWTLEEGEAPAVPLSHLRVFHAAGRAWRFSCPTTVRATTRGGAAPTEITLQSLTLEFEVSLDEEHVHLRARDRGCLLDFGERAYHYLLLTLSRARLADALAGAADRGCGWVDVGDLCRNSRVTPGQVSVEVFRIRQQFVAQGVVDASSIIERRPGQLRVGLAAATISRR